VLSERLAGTLQREITKIHERYPKSLANLVSFIGAAAEVHLFDNSAESADGLPRTMRVFRMRGKRIIEPDLETLMPQTPNWAKPVVAAAIKVHTARRKARKKNSQTHRHGNNVLRT
jgi:hypothetical protein